MAELSLPERIVHAAEQAIQDIAATVFKGITGVESVEGYPTDLAKAAFVAGIEAWADDLDGRYPIMATTCRALALQVQHIRPLEVT